MDDQNWPRPPGYYWTRSRDPEFPAVSVAEFHNGKWYFAGVDCSSSEQEIEVLSGPLAPPDRRAQSTPVPRARAALFPWPPGSTAGVQMITAVFLAMRLCAERTPGDGTMHLVRKVLTDAIDSFDREIRQ